MKKKTNVFSKLMVIFFIMFMILYIITKSGYYETKLQNRVKLTDQKIKQFEDDVKNGKLISIESYYTETKPNYSSFASKTGRVMSQKLSDNLIVFFTKSGQVLKKLFW